MKNILIETQYLPPIVYFCALHKADIITLERHEHFIKQSYRNRCHINTPQGANILTVPLTAKHGKVVITDIKIDHRQKWLNNHWRTIQSAYGNAPFFEYYSSDLHDILFKKHQYLYDLNYDLLSMCLKWLKWEKRIEETKIFNTVSDAYTDLRDVINCKKPEKNNKYGNTIQYTQVFGNMFVPNLSIVDLVFCSGPQANKFLILQTSM